MKDLRDPNDLTRNDLKPAGLLRGVPRRRSLSLSLCLLLFLTLKRHHSSHMIQAFHMLQACGLGSSHRISRRTSARRPSETPRQARTHVASTSPSPTLPTAPLRLMMMRSSLPVNQAPPCTPFAQHKTPHIHLRRHFHLAPLRLMTTPNFLPVALN